MGPCCSYFILTEPDIFLEGVGGGAGLIFDEGGEKGGGGWAFLFFDIGVPMLLDDCFVGVDIFKNREGRGGPDLFLDGVGGADMFFDTVEVFFDGVEGGTVRLCF